MQSAELVLDTNVVLDWLAFGHPVGLSIAPLLASGACRWVATRAMRDELAHVIVRESLARWQLDADHLWARWGRTSAWSAPTRTTRSSSTSPSPAAPRPC